MKKVIILRGLQSSGKSTWAKQLVSENPNKYKRINNDDLRAMLDCSLFSKGNEKFIIDVRNQLILMALENNKTPIVDNTNLNPVHERDIRKLVEGIAEVEIKDFTHVSLEECIKRDQKRANYVGEKVIRDTWKKWLTPKPEKYEWIDGLPFVVLSDMDGSLSLFDRDKKSPYNRDFENDELNVALASILRGNNVILLSGRNEKFRKQTEEFLNKNNVEYLALFMRKDGDDRNDVIVKKEIFENEIRGKYNVKFIADDRNRLVSLWRSMGIPCFQVNDGDF